MNHYKTLKSTAALVVSCLVMLSAAGQSCVAATGKPVIAIKEVNINSGIRSYARKHLNLSTILNEMEMSIQRNRKFDLVSRAKNETVLKSIREEQRFSQSELSAGNAAATGKIKNANYLILPTVQDFKFYRSSIAVPNLEDKYQRVDSGMLEMQVKVVDTSTGVIKSTFYMKSSFATRKKIVNSKRGTPNSVYFTKMAKDVATQMTDQLVDAVFPMRILNIQGTTAYINRGKDGGLRKGQVLIVFQPGVDLIDPDTGENLGSAETRIGRVKIIRINPKFTITNIINGAGTVAKGNIVRE